MTNIEVVSVAGEPGPIRSLDDQDLIDRVQARFERTICLSDRLSNLIHDLELRPVRYCVFGGWVRDSISEIREKPVAGPPRDIDFVVRGLEIAELSRLLPFGVRPTIFGGIQSDVGPIPFDIWPIHETFLIKYLGLAPTFESLLRSTDFGINAGLFFPRQGNAPPEILDGGMQNALRQRIIAFNANTLPFPVMQCARIAAYAGKLSLGLAPTVRAFMQAIIANPARREEVLLGLQKYYPESTFERGRLVLEAL